MSFLTLEQLDQFGALDDLPFSLDNNWTDEGVCGPFTLEGLDQFSTNLDALAFSLDSDVWNTACIKLARGVSFVGSGSLTVLLPDFVTAEAAFTGEGTLSSTARLTVSVQAEIAGNGELSSSATRIRTAQAEITGAGSLSADAVRVRLGDAQFAGSGSLSSDALRIRTAAGDILGQGTLSASARTQETFFVGANFVAEGTLNATAIIAEPISVAANITGTGDLTGNISVTYTNNSASFVGVGSLNLQIGDLLDVAGAFYGSSSVAASVYIYGEEWSPVSDETNNWSEIPPESNAWVEIQAGNNEWRLRA